MYVLCVCTCLFCARLYAILLPHTPNTLPTHSHPNTHTQDISPDGNTQVVWAYATTNDFVQHSAQGSVLINFATGAVSSESDPLKVAHGFVMTVAMGIVLPLGVLIARFGKGSKGSAMWFHLHRGLQSLGVVMLIAAFAIAIKFENKAGNKHFDCIHARLGLAVVVLTLLQPLNALVRPHKGKPHRNLWEWIHKGSGYLVLFLSLITIFLGMKRYDAGLVYYGLYGTVVAVFVIASLVLSITTRVKPAAYSMIQSDD